MKMDELSTFFLNSQSLNHYISVSETLLTSWLTINTWLCTGNGILDEIH